MPRARVQAVTFETVVDSLAREGTRHIIRRKKGQSPWLWIFDKHEKKSKSLKPLYWERIEDVQIASEICRSLGDDPYPQQTSVELIIRKVENNEKRTNSFSAQTTSSILTFRTCCRVLRYSSAQLGPLNLGNF